MTEHLKDVNQLSPQAVSHIQKLLGNPSPPPLYGISSPPIDISKTLAEARKKNILSIQKGLFYVYVTTHHFELEDEIRQRDLASTASGSASAISVEDNARAAKLLDALHEHFAPTLFQAPAGKHMECSDALADAWLTTVVPEAMAHEGPGLSTPLEVLQTWIDADWKSRGVCEECEKGVKQEWLREQSVIWAHIGSWLGLPEIDDEGSSM